MGRDMAREVERKFLVSGEGWREEADRGTELSQFYLAAEPDRSVRVRTKRGAAPILTVKLGSGARERDEFEYAIPEADAAEMRAYARGRVVEKTRYHVHHLGRLFEVDVFHGGLDGLIVAELETEEDVPDEALPSWIGREVTGDPGYYNASLALRGLPEGCA
jgi:adenylate cyclase